MVTNQVGTNCFQVERRASLIARLKFKEINGFFCLVGRSAHSIQCVSLLVMNGWSLLKKIIGHHDFGQLTNVWVSSANDPKSRGITLYECVLHIQNTVDCTRKQYFCLNDRTFQRV